MSVPLSETEKGELHSTNVLVTQLLFPPAASLKSCAAFFDCRQVLFAALSHGLRARLGLGSEVDGFPL